MIYLSAQPDSIYYAWQVEIMLENFISKGIEKQNIHIVVGYKDKISNNFKKLREKYRDVVFGFYPDYRPKTKYVSSIRPFLLYQHFKKQFGMCCCVLPLLMLLRNCFGFDIQHRSKCVDKG